MRAVRRRLLCLDRAALPAQLSRVQGSAFRVDVLPLVEDGSRCVGVPVLPCCLLSVPVLRSCSRGRLPVPVPVLRAQHGAVRCLSTC